MKNLNNKYFKTIYRRGPYLFQIKNVSNAVPIRLFDMENIITYHLSFRSYQMKTLKEMLVRNYAENNYLKNSVTVFYEKF